MATSDLLTRYSDVQEPVICLREVAQSSSPTGHYDLISLLGRLQFFGIDYLPIKWLPATKDLGQGGSARVSQALVNSNVSWAFKRPFSDDLIGEKDFERLGKEACVLTLVKNENLIRIEAYCYEISKETERISPVLIFEKFPLGNLQDFLLSKKTGNITLSERLGFCADIANALAALHGRCYF